MENLNQHWHEATQWMCSERNSPSPQGRWNIGPAIWGQIFSKLDINSEFWQITLAKTKCDYPYHTFWPIQCLRPLRFLGKTNQLGKSSQNLAQLTKSLLELLSKNCTWMWGSSQTEAFTKVKEELTQPKVLALYDPMAPMKVSADASSNGLGAVLMQKQKDSSWRGQSSMPPDPCLQLKCTMLKFRKWPSQHWPVRGSQ